MVGIHPDVLIGVRFALGGQVEAVLGGEVREFGDNLVPLGLARQPLALTPELGGTQAEMPVRQLIRRIDRLVGLERLLCGDAALEQVAVVLGIIGHEVRHELGRLLDEVEILIDDFLRRIRPVEQLGKIDQVRLLPDQEGPRVGGSLQAGRIRHLHPAHAFETLALGNRARHGLDLAVPRQAAGEQILVAPEREMGLVPPDHLHVELAVPGIVGQARLLGRRVARAVDGQQILAQYHAALQLRGARIGAAAEVHHTPLLPELLPIGSGSGAGCRCILGGEFGLLLAEQGREVQVPALGAQPGLIGTDHLQAAIVIGDLDVIDGRIEGVPQDGDSLALRDNLGAVQFVLGPVAGVVGMTAGRIRQAEPDAYRRLGLHRHGHQIPVGIAGGLHFIALVRGEERGADHPVPHIQGLVDPAQRGLLDVGEADHAEVQAVRVDAVPVGSVQPAPVADLAGIEFLVAAAEVVRQQGLFELQIIGIGERMPTPLRLRAEGHARAVALREGLQAGHVGRESEAAIADRQGGERVQGRQVGVVAVHESGAVDLAVAGAKQREDRQEEGDAFHMVMVD